MSGYGRRLAELEEITLEERQEYQGRLEILQMVNVIWLDTWEAVLDDLHMGMDEEDVDYDERYSSKQLLDQARLLMSLIVDTEKEMEHNMELLDRQRGEDV